jgi:hypothetical protein
MDRPTVDLDTALDMIDSCEDLVQLFTLATQLAEMYHDREEQLLLLADMCVHQLEYILDKQTAKEAVDAGRVRPMTHSGAMAKA